MFTTRTLLGIPPIADVAGGYVRNVVGLLAEQHVFITWPPGKHTPIHGHYVGCEVQTSNPSVSDDSMFLPMAQVLFRQQQGDAVVPCCVQFLKPHSYFADFPGESEGDIHLLANVGHKFMRSHHLYHAPFGSTVNKFFGTAKIHFPEAIGFDCKVINCRDVKNAVTLLSSKIKREQQVLPTIVLFNASEEISHFKNALGNCVSIVDGGVLEDCNKAVDSNLYVASNGDGVCTLLNAPVVVNKKQIPEVVGCCSLPRLASLGKDDSGIHSLLTFIQSVFFPESKVEHNKVIGEDVTPDSVKGK